MVLAACLVVLATPALGVTGAQGSDDTTQPVATKPTAKSSGDDDDDDTDTDTDTGDGDGTRATTGGNTASKSGTGRDTRGNTDIGGQDTGKSTRGETDGRDGTGKSERR